MYQKDHVTVCPPAKFFVSTEIPQGMDIVVCTCISPHCAVGYEPEAGHIQDEYRVWVSPSRLCVESFLQTGVHNHHLPIAYNVCTAGHRVSAAMVAVIIITSLFSYRLVMWWMNGLTIITL